MDEEEKKVQKEKANPLIDTCLFTHMHTHTTPTLDAPREGREGAHEQRENTVAEGNGVGRERARTCCATSPVHMSLPSANIVSNMPPQLWHTCLACLTALARNTHRLCLVTRRLPRNNSNNKLPGEGGAPLREQCATCRRFGFFLSSGGGDGGGSTPAQRVPAALLSLLYASSLFQLVSKVFP